MLPPQTPDRPQPSPETHDPADPHGAGLKVSHRPIPLASILTAFAIAAALAAVWMLSFVLLLGFASVLLAIALRNSAKGLARWLPISISVGVFLALGLVLAVLGGLGWYTGPEIAKQFRELFAAIPEAWTTISDWLHDSSLGNMMMGQMPGGEGAGADTPDGEAIPDVSSLGGVLGFLRGTVNAATGSIVNLFLVITVAIFLALNPRPYVQGSLRLVPIKHRPRAAEIMREIGDKLGSWMAGQAVDMLVVAALSGLGLWAIGIPLALVLGFIAGVTNVIPYVGPFIGGGIAVLFALTQGTQDALYVLILFLVIQQVEGNIIMPLIQRRAAGLPPVMTIFGVIAFGVLFGLPGILVAAPLLVVAMVLVQRIYIEDILGDDLPPHRPDAPPADWPGPQQD